jgi:hypothetical protein
MEDEKSMPPGTAKAQPAKLVEPAMVMNLMWLLLSNTYRHKRSLANHQRQKDFEKGTGEWEKGKGESVQPYMSPTLYTFTTHARKGIVDHDRTRTAIAITPRAVLRRSVIGDVSEIFRHASKLVDATLSFSFFRLDLGICKFDRLWQHRSRSRNSTIRHSYQLSAFSKSENKSKGPVWSYPF